jgi:hypothetical protein
MQSWGISIELQKINQIETLTNSCRSCPSSRRALREGIQEPAYNIRQPDVCVSHSPDRLHFEFGSSQGLDGAPAAVTSQTSNQQTWSVQVTFASTRLHTSIAPNVKRRTGFGSMLCWTQWSDKCKENNRASAPPGRTTHSTDTVRV